MNTTDLREELAARTDVLDADSASIAAGVTGHIGRRGPHVPVGSPRERAAGTVELQGEGPRAQGGVAFIATYTPTD